MSKDQGSEETQALIQPSAKDEPIVQVDGGPGGQTSAGFMPIIGLMIFGVTAGWIIGHYHGSILWIIPCVAIVSGLTHRRIKNFRKYLLHALIRISEKQKVDNHMESVEWINLILERFWTVFEPALSAQVIEKVNLVLEQQKPIFLDKLMLKEFTLGSNAPCIVGTRAYRKTASNMIHLDMDVCFYPNELSEESKSALVRMNPELAEDQTAQWNSKIVAVARVGKGIVGVDVPVMIKEIAFFGKLRIQLELMQEMPLLKQVQVTFLETPKIDFILRPLKALDLMDLPGLSNWMMSMINDNLEAQLVNPNRITINIAGTIDKIKTGVLKVKIITTQGIEFAPEAEPFIRLELNGKVRGKTPKASHGDSIHGRFFILTRTLNKPLLFQVMSSANQCIGTASYPLEELAQKAEQLDNLSADVISPEGKPIGQVLFNLLYVTAEDVVDPEADLNSETGIFSVSMKQGEKLLPVGKSKANIIAEAYIHPKKLEIDAKTVVYNETDSNSYRFGIVEAEAKKPVIWENEPDWEIYLDKASRTQITVLFRDAENDKIICKWNGQVKKLLNRSDWFTIPGCDGRIKMAFNYRPTSDSGSSEELVTTEPSLGILRLKLSGANNLKEKKVYYAVAEKGEIEIGRTGKSAETAQPTFNKTITYPIISTSEVIKLEMYEKDIFKDPLIGSIAIPMSYVSQHPNEDIQKEEPLLDEKGSPLETTFKYEVGFYPISISPERAALEHANSAYAIIPEDGPSDSNCAIFAVEQIKVRGLPEGQSGKSLFVEVLLEDEAEPMIKSKVGAETFAEEGIFSWKFYAESFLKEHSNEQITVKLIEDRSLGPDTIGTLKLDLKDGQAGKWYKLKGSDAEIQLIATCKPLKLVVPTEAENQGVLTVELQSAQDLLAVDSNGFSDPFAVFRLNSTKVYKSEVIKKSLTPVWNETFQTDIYHRDRDILSVDFRDWNRVSVSRTLGQVTLDLSQLPIGQWEEFDVPLENVSTGRVRMRLRFETKGLAKKAANIVAAPATAVVSGVKSIGAFGSKIGDKFKSKSGDSGEDDDIESGGEEKKKSKVGSFFSSVGDKMTGGGKAKEEAAPVTTTQTVAAPNVGKKEAAAMPDQDSEEDAPEALYISFIELRVKGVSKPFDSKIKVRIGDKTIFKTEDLKGTLTPKFTPGDAAFILPDPDPSNPLRFTLNWSVKSDPAVPEAIFNPETMDVIEEKDDHAIASVPFPLKGDIRAEAIFKFGEADATMIENLSKPQQQHKSSNPFSSIAHKMNK